MQTLDLILPQIYWKSLCLYCICLINKKWLKTKWFQWKNISHFILYFLTILFLVLFTHLLCYLKYKTVIFKFLPHCVRLLCEKLCNRYLYCFFRPTVHFKLFKCFLTFSQIYVPHKYRLFFNLCKELQQPL